MPQFPGFGLAPTVPKNHRCLRVFIAGDSLAAMMAPQLQHRLREIGRCATVIDASHPGTSLGDWTERITLAAEATPDIVVIKLAGNEGNYGPYHSSPQYLEEATSAILTITDQAAATGATVYWVIPPASSPGCAPASADDRHAATFADWIKRTLPSLRPVKLIDWRRPFGGKHYTSALKFGDWTVMLRTPDCVHLTSAGQTLAAEATALGIQDEWRSTR